MSAPKLTHNRRRQRAPSAMVACTVLLACSSFLGPDAYAPPPVDPSLDPGAVVAPVPLFHPCDGWIGAEPQESEVLADVAFVRAGPESPGNQPTAENILTLLRAGGAIVHQFHLPVVRARIPKSSVAALSRDSSVLLFYRVLNPMRYDWLVSVGFRAGTPIELAMQQFATAGGRVTSVFENVSILYGLLPDRSIPTLRRMSNVEYVEMAGEWPVC